MNFDITEKPSKNLESAENIVPIKKNEENKLPMQLETVFGPDEESKRHLQVIMPQELEPSPKDISGNHRVTEGWSSDIQELLKPIQFSDDDSILSRHSLTESEENSLTRDSELRSREENHDGQFKDDSLMQIEEQIK